MRAAVVVLALVLALSGCNDAPDEHPGGREMHYPTHCGVGQVSVGGVTYYPTGIYKDGEPFATDPGANGGPTPWDDPLDPTVSNGNATFGVIVMGDDGTAEFFVNGGDYSVRLSDDEAEALWIIEGCA